MLRASQQCMHILCTCNVCTYHVYAVYAHTSTCNVFTYTHNVCTYTHSLTHSRVCMHGCPMYAHTTCISLTHLRVCSHGCPLEIKTALWDCPALKKTAALESRICSGISMLAGAFSMCHSPLNATIGSKEATGLNNVCMYVFQVGYYELTDFWHGSQSSTNNRLPISGARTRGSKFQNPPFPRGSHRSGFGLLHARTSNRRDGVA
jgi:hypothetical protein